MPLGLVAHTHLAGAWHAGEKRMVQPPPGEPLDVRKMMKTHLDLLFAQGRLS